MNILYHHRTLGDGAEGVHVSSMVDAFRALGHDVRVTSLIGDKTNYSTPRTRFLEQVTKWTPRSAYELMEIGYSLLGYRMLTSQNNGWKPQLVYERYTLFNFSGLMAARRIGIPLVLEINAPLAYEREIYERLALKRAARRVERFLCSSADLVVVVSTPLKDYLVQQGAPAERIVVLPNGTDPDLFRPNAEARDRIRSRLGIPTDAVVAGFLGILRPWHGVEMLIEAIARLREEKKGIHILIIGDGPSQADLEALARSRGLANVVTFTGRIPHRTVPDYLAAFDIGVSPRATFYASPMKVLEYMATGMAVVAPRMPNLEDVITDGLNGALFHPENADDLARVLAALVQDAALRARLGTSARASVLDGRTWRHNAERILDLLAKRRK